MSMANEAGNRAQSSVQHAGRTVLVTGGTGFLGRHLCRALVAAGWQVILWRHRTALPPGLPGVSQVASLDEIDARRPIDAVVNLAGARILGPPWTRRRRQLLLGSRIGTTTALMQWLSTRGARPLVLVSASAVGYYGVRGEERLDEAATPQPVFQSELCRRWEEAALRCRDLGMRCVLLRFGVVLGSDGGALPAFARPARFGGAAVMGAGTQGFPWIHVDDAVALITWSIGRADIEGPVNAVAPEAVSQRQLQQALCDVLRRPLWLRVPAWPLRLALGEMAQLLVDGQYVVPARAQAAGFVFAHPGLRDALSSLLVAGPRG
jgi:uncharacterized protein (TIGR01777 family)